MSKISKVVALLFTLVIIMSGGVFASENYTSAETAELVENYLNTFVITEKYSYVNNRNTDVKNAFVEIRIGSGDFVQYQDDKYIIISPQPDEIKEDKFGNKWARFDFSLLKPHQQIDITIKRRIVSKSFYKSISTDANSESLDGFEIYLQPQERIDSDYEKIVSKAKELTKKKRSDYEKALAIFEYVSTEMENATSLLGANEHGSIFAIDNLCGTCEECTTLFVAMCRAVGIPSRIIEGYEIQNIHVSETSKDVANYLIAEIYLSDYGWIPVDPSVKYALNGTRLPFYKAFGNISNSTFIAMNIYEVSKGSRMFKTVEETNYSVEVNKVMEMVEKKNLFKDIDNYTWAESDIDFLHSIGVINGYSETEFRPQNNISRIEFVSMLARTLRFLEYGTLDSGEVYYYADYDIGHWSNEDYTYLMRCYQNLSLSDINNKAGIDQITNVFGNEMFEMNKPITRAEVVALMDLFLVEKNIDSNLSDISENKFIGSIEKAVSSGIITGYPDMTFRPNNNITRAEIAVILGRFVGEKEFI